MNTQPALTLLPHPEFANDANNLPFEIREVLMDKIVALRYKRIRGQELGVLSNTGNLSDCRRVYIDLTTNMDPRYRLVYREVYEGQRLVALELISTGERDQLSVYLDAVARLRR